MNHKHEAPLSGYLYDLPYLPLLACPLMHLFTHGDHGHGGNGAHPQRKKGNQGE